MAEIEFYGADWCSDCRRSKKLLDTLGVEYEMLDVEAVPENASRAEEIAGRKNIPQNLLSAVQWHELHG
jgi:glutaredoxin